MDTYDLEALYGTVEEDMAYQFFDYDDGARAEARDLAKACAAWDEADAKQWAEEDPSYAPAEEDKCAWCGVVSSKHVPCGDPAVWGDQGETDVSECPF